jgi:hypothetical protein
MKTDVYLRQVIERLAPNFKQADIKIDLATASPIQMIQAIEQYEKWALSNTPLLRINYFCSGQDCTHNFPCAVFPNDLAVLDANNWVFHPSLRAQNKGWRLVQAKSKFGLWILRKFFGV